ncbi:MAG: hypothetical protein LKF61_01365 [Eggerthellaceae bacterium]|jgi:predicted  nucleic acid-binding Zn-ribbon protein|nr:hypothetical protein [Eggerthellaceae bacterium]MCH4221252.1 hypothetical protein [Eggerthellaceae bacterium]
MEATSEQIDLLMRLQEIDRSILKSKKDLEELPQRAQIAALRQKQELLDQKNIKAEDLYQEAKANVDRLTCEDERLESKQTLTQQRIDESQGDFRSVSALSKDLDGVAKRRETVAFEKEKADKRLHRAESIRRKIHSAQRKFASEIKELEEAFQEQSGHLQEDITKAEAARKKPLNGLNEELIDAYDRAARRCGGVALSELHSNHCTVCRSLIEPNRLLQIKHDAPLSICPSCRRILVVR